MKEIETSELIALCGGSSSSEHDCMWFIQYEANTHQSSGNEDAEKGYWDNWADRYEDCANSLG